MQIGLGLGMTNTATGGAAGTQPLPGANARLASFSFDGALPDGSIFTRNGNAWSGETGLILSHNLCLRSEDYTNPVWQSVGTTVTGLNVINFSGDETYKYQVIPTVTGQPYAVTFIVSGSGTITLAEGMNLDHGPITLTDTPTAYTFSGVSPGTNLSVFYVKRTGNTATSVTVHGTILNNGLTRTDYVKTGDTPVYSPRFVSGKSGQAFLPEVPSSNLLPYSRSLGNLSHGTEISASPSAVTAYGGRLLVDKVIEATTASAMHRLYAGPSVSAIPHTLWIDAKAGERNWLILQLEGSLSGNRYQSFNLTTGVVGATTVGVLTARCIDVSATHGAGWWRCSITMTPGAETITAYMWVSNADSVAAYVGTVGYGFYATNFELETLPYITSPIVTDSAGAARVLESLHMPSSGILLSDGTTTRGAEWIAVADGRTLDAPAWPVGANVTQGIGVVHFETTSGGAGIYSNASPMTGALTVGQLYRIEYELKNYEYGYMEPQIGQTLLPVRAGNGVKVDYGYCTVDGYMRWYNKDGACKFDLDNLSIRPATYVSAGTIMLWADLSDNALYGVRSLIQHSGGNNNIDIYSNGTSLIGRTSDNVGLFAIPSGSIAGLSGFHHIVLTWGPTETALWLDAVKLQGIPTPNIPSVLLSTFSIGISVINSYQFCKALDNFNLFSRPLTAAEINAWYKKGK